jgi:hypothetical protein
MSASRSRLTVGKGPRPRSRVAKATKATGSGTRRSPIPNGSATSRHVAPKPPIADPDTPTVAGVRISHPDRLIYPDLGISKIQLAHYYEEIAEWIVPHVANRPLTLVHCPRLIESYWIAPRVRLRDATLIRQYANTPIRRMDD